MQRGRLGGSEGGDGRGTRSNAPAFKSAGASRRQQACRLGVDAPAQGKGQRRLAGVFGAADQYVPLLVVRKRRSHVVVVRSDAA